MLYKEIVKKISVHTEKKIKQKNYLKTGQIAVIDQGATIVGGYSNDIDKQITCNLPVIVFGDHTKIVKFISFPFCAGADGIKVLQPKQCILPKYLYYLTKYLVLKLEDKGYARHYQYLEKKEVVLPSLSEQERIVAKIEELFSQLDDGVNTLEKLQRQIDTYRQSVLKYIFEDKIKSTDYKEIPLKNLVIPQGGLRRGPFGGSIKKSCFVSEGYKVYEQGNAIHDSIEYGKYFISQEKYEEMRSFQVQPHDLLVSCSGTVGCIME